MTRNEFIDNITEWYELKDFCNDFDCDVCEDIYDDDDYDDYVEDDVRDAVGECSWREIRDLLCDLPSGYDYYRRNGNLDYDGMGNDDFEEYKERALEWGDDYGVWDEEDEEFEESDDFFDFTEEASDEEEPVEDEDFSVGDLIGMCNVVLVAIQNDEEAKQREEDKEFAQLFNMDGRKILT